MVLSFVLSVFPQGIAAQDGGPAPPSGGLKFSVNALTLYQSETQVDGGGSLKVLRYGVSADALKSVTENLRVGLGLVYELDDYDFSGLTDFAVAKPWDQIHRFGVNLPLNLFL